MWLRWRKWSEPALAFVAYSALATFVFVGVVIVWWVQTRPANAAVPWPDWRQFNETFKHRVGGLADVMWNLGVTEGGYERFPHGVPHVYASQHNWAYFPLTPWLGRLLRIFTRTSWWSLQVLSLAAAAGFMTFARTLDKRWHAATTEAWPIAHALVLLFFVLPIAWPCINFTVLPMLVEYALFFAALRLAREGETPSRFSIALVLALGPIVAFSRPQGLMLDAIIAAALFLHLRAPMKVRIGVALGLLASIGAVFLYYRWAVGEPLAWYRVQRAWGRKTTMPWTVWMQELRGYPFDQYTSYALVGIRALVSGIAIAWAAVACGRDLKSERRPETMVEAWVLLATALLWIMPYTTGSMLAAHRYLCFAMYPFLARPDRNITTRIPALGLFALVFLRMFEMVFFFGQAQFVTW
jgi:hypothetical protein